MSQLITLLIGLTIITILIIYETLKAIQREQKKTKLYFWTKRDLLEAFKKDIFNNKKQKNAKTKIT